MDANYHDSKDDENSLDDSESQIGLVSSRFKAFKTKRNYPSGTSIVIVAQFIVILILGVGLATLLGKLPSYYPFLSSSSSALPSLDVGINCK